MIKAVFFDLDGTLLPMELDIFMKAYLGSLAKALAPIGYDPDRLVKSILSGSYAMVKNDGSMSNEDVFWNCFNTSYGIDGRKDEKYFYDFYVNEFDKIHKVCGYNPHSSQVVKSIKNMGIRMILATNPLFPSIATEMFPVSSDTTIITASLVSERPIAAL